MGTARLCVAAQPFDPWAGSGAVWKVFCDVLDRGPGHNGSLRCLWWRRERGGGAGRDKEPSPHEKKSPTSVRALDGYPGPE